MYFVKLEDFIEYLWMQVPYKPPASSSKIHEAASNAHPTSSSYWGLPPQLQDGGKIHDVMCLTCILRKLKVEGCIKYLFNRGRRCPTSRPPPRSTKPFPTTSLEPWTRPSSTDPALEGLSTNTAHLRQSGPVFGLGFQAKS